MIVMKDVTKTFENGKHTVNVLNGISFEIHSGDMISIIGPSGSGKSTLLHILGGLDVPTSGSYQIDGKEVSTLSDRELAKLRNQRFGFVHQHFVLMEEESALENVSVPLLFSDTPFKQIDRIALEMLEQFGITELMDKKVCTLSGGEKQRVAIARAIVAEPDIILADEPTGALDQENTEKIMESFLRLNKEGKTIIIITHDPQVATKCKIQYKMENGQLMRIKNYM